MGYIVGSICFKKIIIELDGEQHAKAESYDTGEMIGCDYKILMF